MPDITMCHGDNCPKKESCYRFMAIPNDLWQSYFVEAPVKEDGGCDHYWEIVTPEANKKITRENIAEHLVRYQLEMVGKTWEDAMADEQWYYNFTMTQQQFDEFMTYALPLTKKVLRCSKAKAQRALDWFNLQFGLRIYPPPMELNSKPIKK